MVKMDRRGENCHKTAPHLKHSKFTVTSQKTDRNNEFKRDLKSVPLTPDEEVLGSDNVLSNILLVSLYPFTSIRDLRLLKPQWR